MTSFYNVTLGNWMMKMKFFDRIIGANALDEFKARLGPREYGMVYRITLGDLEPRDFPKDDDEIEFDFPDGLYRRFTWRGFKEILMETQKTSDKLDENK